MTSEFDIVILGLSVTSSWGNGHATTYRSLIRGLAGLGHRVLFLERDQPWYAGNRDEPNPAGATTVLYGSVDELIAKHEAAVRGAGLVIVGSFVPDGVRVAEWATAAARGRTGARPHRLLRYRHPGDAREARGGRARVHHAGPRPEIRSLPLLHRRPDVALHREPLWLARRARSLLFRRYRAVRAREARRAVGPRVPRHLQCRPAAGARKPDARAGPPLVRGPLRGGRADVPRGHPLAGERLPRDPPLAARAPRVLRRAALHAERDAGGHEAGGLFAERPAVRSRRVRGAGDQRLVARPRQHFRDRPRRPGVERSRADAALPARRSRHGASGDRRGGARACPARAYAGAPRHSTGGVLEGSE